MYNDTLPLLSVSTCTPCTLIHGHCIVLECTLQTGKWRYFQCSDEHSSQIVFHNHFIQGQLLRFQAQKQLQIPAMQEQSRGASKAQPAADIFLLLCPQWEETSGRAATWDLRVVTFTPAPLSSLFFRNLVFYQTGNKCSFNIKRLGTVVLPQNIVLAHCQGRPQNTPLKSQNAVLYSCSYHHYLPSSVGDNISPGKDFIVGCITSMYRSDNNDNRMDLICKKCSQKCWNLLLHLVTLI